MPDAERARRLRASYPDLPAASDADLALLDALDRLVARIPVSSATPAGFRQLLAEAATRPGGVPGAAVPGDGREAVARAGGGAPVAAGGSARGWLRQALAFAGGALAFALVAALLVALFRDGAPGRRADAPGSASPAGMGGETILYVAPNGGDSWGSTLWALDPASGATRALYVNPDGQILAPAVAPDASRVAFSTGRELLVLPLDGSGIVTVADGMNAGTGHPVWSPDGRELAYDPGLPTGGSSIAIAAADGSGTRELPGTAGGRTPRWSPDGSTLLYVSDTTLRLIDRDGLNPRTLVERATYDAGEWSPDGTRIVYAANVESESDLIILDVEAGEARQLTSGPEVDANPHWSPDGSTIAFDRIDGTNGTGSVWLVDAAGGEPRQIGATHAPVENAFVADHVLGWTPDGEQLRFVAMSNPLGGPPEISMQGQLGLVNRDGSDRRLLTDTLRFAWDTTPVWLPVAFDALPGEPVIAPTVTPYPGATPRPGQPVTPTPELGAIEPLSVTSLRPLQPGEERAFTFDLRAEVRADAGTLLAWNVKGSERMLADGTVQRYLIARPLDYVNYADGAVFAELIADGARWQWTVRGWTERGDGQPDPHALPQELALPLLVLDYASRVYVYAGTPITMAPEVSELPTGYPFQISAAAFRIEASEPAGGRVTSARLSAFDADDRAHLLAEATFVDVALLPILDPATEMFVVPDAPAAPPLQYAPPADDALPAGLRLVTHERASGGGERLVFQSASGLQLALVVGPSAGGFDRAILDWMAPPGSGTTVHTSETALGPVGWLSPADAASITKMLAIWDDGHYRYRLDAVTIPTPDAWTEPDLVALVEALAGAR